MDFFQAQDNARIRTRTLILLFAAAVVAINLAVYALVYLLLQKADLEVSGLSMNLSPNIQLLLVVSVLTTALIIMGSLFRTAQLKHGGGASVAELLGARNVIQRGADKAERRLINVVEEMAIASGTPVPAIYVLPEQGINAFAAGYSPNDATVTVTSGALSRLNRDELQGVVAHEFSHILNGDMRLNIRLIGVLYGILLLATIGRGILRGSSRRGGSRKGGGGQAALLGLGLIAIGWIGVFFGRMIQAATSRQREYLADASAVQFTRNPRGMAGALAKAKSAGSLIEDHHAQEASHLFFATGVKAFTAALETHPPLLDRIRRIDPAFDADADLTPAEDDASESPAAETPAAGRLESFMTGAALMASIGSTPLPAQAAFAAELLRSLPASVNEAAHDPDGAAALLFALLLHDGPHAAAQLAALEAHGGKDLVDRVTVLAKDVGTANIDAIARETHPWASHRMSLLDLLQPALRRVASDQRPRIQQTARAMVAADQRTDVFEFAVLHLVGNVLKPAKSAPMAVPAPKPAQPKASTRDDFQSVLSAVAWSGTGDVVAATRAFVAGVASLPRELDGITLQPREAVSFDRLDGSLSRLRVAKPGMKRTLLEACVHGVAAADGRVHAEEAEALRAIAEAVGCPMPPVVVSAVEQPARPA